MWRRLHRDSVRPGSGRAGAQLLLLLGTPGAGKRALGHYLASVRGFTHLDFGDPDTRQRVLDAGRTELRDGLAALTADGHGVVITWEAGFAGQAAQVGRLRSLGFEPWWLDSDRGAACRAYFAQGPARWRSFRLCDSFESDGRFRPLEAIADELVGAAAGGRRRRDLLRAPRARLASRLAAALLVIGRAAGAALLSAA